MFAGVGRVAGDASSQEAAATGRVTVGDPSTSALTRGRGPKSPRRHPRVERFRFRALAEAWILPMMSRENLEVVRRMYEAFNCGDAETALGCFDPDVVMDATHRVDGRIGHGREEMGTILAEWLGSWDDFRDEVEEMHDLGERILLISTQSGRGKGSGIEWEGRFGMLYELRDGRIVRWTVYDDPTAAAQAAGLAR